MSSSQLPVLGIDLGTSTCLACVQLDGSGRLTTIRPDARMTSDVMPSYFCWNRQRGALIGEEARQMMRDGRYKQDVVRCVKRKMKESRDYFFSSGGELFSPMAVSSFYLKQLAQSHLFQRFGYSLPLVNDLRVIDDRAAPFPRQPR